MHMTITDDFSALGLSEQMLEAVRAKGFETPTAIQKLTIPHLLTKPNDIIAQSQTGTGKTAAYGLPILQTLEPARGPIQAIILVPTRELALQAAEELLSYNREKRLSITAIYGGAAMSEQLRRLAKGIDIVVGTPGRVLDHIRRGTMKLENVRYLVLDEADEMLNMGFVEDVEEIMSHTSDERRVLLFSATMPERIIRLSKTYMRDTEIVRVEHKQITADLTEQIYFEVREADKFDALTRIIDVEPEFYGIIFARTKIGADETASRLTARGYAAEVLHGDVSQAQREKILRKFRDRTINILVATDVAARGIDVGNLTHVINYSLPQDSESYVHRIGRTGRAGEEGFAISFVTRETMKTLKEIEKLIGKDIPFTTIEGYETDPSVLEKPKRGERKGGTRRGGNKPAGARRTGEKHAERAEREGRRPNAGEGRRRREDDSLVTRGERGGRGGKGRFDRKGHNDRGGRFDRDNRNDRGGNKGGHRGKGGAGRNGEWLSDEEFRSRRNAKNAQARLHKKERKAQNGNPHKANNKKRGGEGGYDYSRFSK